ncbi:MAG: hypothetical protein JJT82_06160 [Legionellaceae bacterium]|nr:hypothetical protein [Legionellaceae bacterium]
MATEPRKCLPEALLRAASYIITQERTMTQTETAVLKKYWPLLVLFLVAFLAAFALSYSNGYSMVSLMHYFMGIFFLILATLKLFHPQQFADGFSRYDLLAQKTRKYAYLYPLLELGLALAYLSFVMPWLTYWCTLILMSFGAMGVYRGVRAGLNINCPCMGSVLNVPLSTVSLFENILMATMAAMMLIQS